MSLELHVAIDNAQSQLEILVPAYVGGKLPQPEIPHALGILYRQLGICRTLLTGLAEPTFVAQMQAASLYLVGLSRLKENDIVTSQAACWWDAIAGGHWKAAESIARLTRQTHNEAHEHEDDFLYITFLMHRYFLAPPSSVSSALFAHDIEQERRLQRWLSVAGRETHEFTLCRALQNRDASAFREVILELAAARDAKLRGQLSKGTLSAEHALWALPIWPQGLALLRLAEREGLDVAFECPGAPEILRVDPPLSYDPDAWKVVDFRARPR